jgi:SAM-dependent methyltransferase
MTAASLHEKAYLAANVAKNLAAPLLRPLRARRGSCGLDSDPEAVEGVARQVVDLAREGGVELPGSSVLELGPGRTPNLALLLRAWGAERILSLDTELQIGSAEVAAAARRVAAGQSEAAGAEELERGARFEAYDGSSIPAPDSGFDLAFSKSVLEHVQRRRVGPLLRELTRTLRPGGAMVHVIDLRDHMFIDGDHAVAGNWLKALEYPERSFDLMFSNRSTYVNRLRSEEWRRAFAEPGLEIVRWDVSRLPLDAAFRRQALDRRWRSLGEDELRVAWVTVVARKPEGG